MVDDQHDNRANHGNKHAVEVETGNPSGAELREQKAAYNGTDNAKDDVEDQTFAGLIHDLAGDEPGDQTQHQPPNY